MKKVLTILFLLTLVLPAIANNRYKGHYFSDIMTDVYKRGGYYYVRHKDSPNVLTVVNNNLNFHQGAINACKDIGMRLPNKDEAPIVFDYLSNVANYNQNIQFWLNDNAAGAEIIKNGTAVKSHTKIPANSNDYAYILWYYGSNRNNRAYEIDVHRKDSNSPYNVVAVCIQDAPPMTDNDRKDIISEDYETYKSSNRESFYGVIKKQYDEVPLGIFYSTNRKYLAQILSNLETIASLSEPVNLKDYNITIDSKDMKKLNKDVKQLINAYNEILIYDDQK